MDEIGDMPLATQAKFLRALQNQEILRVGSLTPRKVDGRDALRYKLKKHNLETVAKQRAAHEG